MQNLGMGSEDLNYIIIVKQHFGAYMKRIWPTLKSETSFNLIYVFLSGASLK